MFNYLETLVKRMHSFFIPTQLIIKLTSNMCINHCVATFEREIRLTNFFWKGSGGNFRRHQEILNFPDVLDSLTAENTARTYHLKQPLPEYQLSESTLHSYGNPVERGV